MTFRFPMLASRVKDLLLDAVSDVRVIGIAASTEMLTAFVALETAIHEFAVDLIS